MKVIQILILIIINYFIFIKYLCTNVINRKYYILLKIIRKYEKL